MFICVKEESSCGQGVCLGGGGGAKCLASQKNLRHALKKAPRGRGGGGSGQLDNHILI